jgi:hypothetical protein
MLVSADGDRLLARIDDGGFSYSYGFGPAKTALTPTDRLAVDAARRAVE